MCKIVPPCVEESGFVRHSKAWSWIMQDADSTCRPRPGSFNHKAFNDHIRAN
jgi:hypothetical protein